MNSLSEILSRAVSDLTALGRQFALVGGLAVSARTLPRFTRDVDLAVAVADDSDSERLVFELQARGYSVLATIEHERTGRLAIVRLLPPGSATEPVVVDLLFDMAGLESEIATEAQDMEVFDNLIVPVARAHHLFALKVLSHADDRPKDRIDLVELKRVLTVEERELASECVERIESSGHARGLDLLPLLRELLGVAGDE